MPVRNKSYEGLNSVPCFLTCMYPYWVKNVVNSTTFL